MGKICVHSQIKNEHLYLKEWLDYNFKLGFDRVYLIEDFGSLSHSAITEEYGDKVVLSRMGDYFTERDMWGHIRQREAQKLFINMYFGEKSDIDWCAFLDVDEFIEMEPGLTLRELVNNFTGNTGFYMFWKSYGANGHITRETGKTCEELYKTDKILPGNKYKHVKYFLNFNYPVAYDYINMHRYPYAVTTNGMSLIKQMEMRPIYDKAWINHYFSKSWEDWKIRLTRGNMTPGIRKAYEFFEVNPDMEIYKDELLRELENLNCPTEDIIYTDIQYSEERKYNFDITILSRPHRHRHDFEPIYRHGIPTKYDIQSILLDWDTERFSHLCILCDNVEIPDGFRETVNKIINTFPKNMIFFGDLRNAEDARYGGLYMEQVSLYPATNVGYVIPGIYKDKLLEFLEITPLYNDIQPNEYIPEIGLNPDFFTSFASIISPYKIIPYPTPLIVQDKVPSSSFIKPRKLFNIEAMPDRDIELPKYNFMSEGFRKKHE